MRPDFEGLARSLQRKDADIIVFIQSEEDLDNLVVRDVPKLQVKTVKGRRHGTPPTAKCLAQLGDLSHYDHIILFLMMNQATSLQQCSCGMSINSV